MRPAPLTFDVTHFDARRGMSGTGLQKLAFFLLVLLTLYVSLAGGA